jgi:class 3 adenylate cyclase
MNSDNLQDLLDKRAQTTQELEKLRTPMTILFSDIKGSSQYAEKRGDVEYMAMINRHNRLLFPVIEGEGGCVVKTIGDSILARFEDPSGAVRAAVGMQRALAKDREGRDAADQIHIRIGMHYGVGLIKDNDVFGDVVNAASRVEHQAEPGQILITEALVEAASAANFQYAKMGRAELKGKDEPIDLYAVAWSESATQQLIKELEVRYERKLKDLKKQQTEIEEAFDAARDQWRNERRNLHKQIEELEQSIERARQGARQQVSEDLQSQLRFQVEELTRSREQLEQELLFMRQKFEAERNNLKSQIAAMQQTVVEAMERSNNPARLAMSIREQVEARMEDARQEWQLQWEGERRRLLAEIERLKKAASGFLADQKREAARRALLEKLGKLPPGSAGPGAKTVDQLEREFSHAKIQWETEREQMDLKLRKLEFELGRAGQSLRNEVYQELRSQYESKLSEAIREKQRVRTPAAYSAASGIGGRSSESAGSGSQTGDCRVARRRGIKGRRSQPSPFPYRAPICTGFR